MNQKHASGGPQDGRQRHNENPGLITFYKRWNWPLHVQSIDTEQRCLCQVRHDTVEPFNFTTLKVGEFACEFILVPLVLAIQTAQFQHSGLG